MRRSMLTSSHGPPFLPGLLSRPRRERACCRGDRAELLYEVVAQALGVLRGDIWVEEIGKGLTELKVKQPAVEHLDARITPPALVAVPLPGCTAGHPAP